MVMYMYNPPPPVSMESQGIAYWGIRGAGVWDLDQTLPSFGTYVVVFFKKT